MLTAITVLGLFALSGFWEKPAEPEIAKTSAQSEAEIPVSPKLTLGTYEGKLALYIGESSYPNKIYEFEVSSLPESDVARLEAGIAVADEKELFALLEDLTS